MIVFNNVTKHYQHHRRTITAVDALTLTIEPHEIFGVVGESGSGKSTLLRLINALEAPDFGSILINDRAVHQLNKKELRTLRQNIGVIFQGFNLLYNRNVFQNVALPLALKHQENEESVLEMLRMVGLESKKDAEIRTLSGGEKQRVAIARALITNPAILLCDEPTASLDSKTQREVIELLRKIQERLKTCIVLVTHDLEVAKALCNRVVILEKGKLQDIVTLEPKPLNPAASYVEYVKQELGL